MKWSPRRISKVFHTAWPHSKDPALRSEVDFSKTVTVTTGSVLEGTDRVYGQPA